MRILMLVNWKVQFCDNVSLGVQPPDYYVQGHPYWFFRYFDKNAEVDVVDIRTFPWLENFEKEKLRFYVIQTLKVLPRLGKYDLILSHGMQSGVVLSLFRRVFRTKAKHVVFDIGAFNSAAESGAALKLMQFASKSIDGVIYHTSRQKEYYQKYFPWIVPKSTFIKFGTDADFFCMEPDSLGKNEASVVAKNPYILCVGYNKRDWDTLYRAYEMLQKKGQDKLLQGRIANRVHLRLIGHADFHPENEGVESEAFIPVTQLMEEIKGALFCVLPLEYFMYSFGQMTLLQQMALGKAVITAKVPSMTDYVTDGENALLYESGNVEELCEKMELVLKDERLRKTLGRNGYDYVKNQWNECHMAKEIEKYINKVVREKA